MSLKSGNLHWGILGTGMIATKFATDLPFSGTGLLEATASRHASSAQAFAQKFGGRAIAGYEALLNDPAIDAVYLSLPNGLHHRWTMKALEAGKHVLCEKPIARNATEAAEMFAYAEHQKLVLVEAFMYRAHPTIQRLIRLVRTGGIGDLRLMRTNFTFSRAASPDDARYDPEQAGGSLMDVGCYCVNFARALAGSEPISAQAVAHKHPLGVDDYAAGTLTFPNGFLATFTCGMTVASDPGTYIAGTEGQIAIDAFWFGKDGFALKRTDGTIEKYETIDAEPIYAIEADAFAGAVRGDRAPWISKDDTLNNMRVLDALRESAGIPVPV
ncbi:MAG: Gfo/Idh/MocA family oxidoreductase [Verrucomicrobiae bacterium]|nr:Gfo/Idh/MocA family oxidoreductase [Verrucomicrobiae bacterium]